MAGTAQAGRAGRDAGGSHSRPGTPQGIGQFSAVQSLAPSLGLEVNPINARDAGEMERDIAAIARVPNRRSILCPFSQPPAA